MSHFLFTSESFNEPPQCSMHREIEADTALERERKFLLEKQSIEKHLNKEIKKLERKESKLSESLNQCVEWEKVQHEGELIKFNFGAIKKGTVSFIVEDWLTNQSYELTFDPKKTVQEEMQARFKRAKKLKAGILPLTQQCEKTQREIDRKRYILEQLQLIQTAEALNLFKTEFSVEKAPAKHQPIGKGKEKKVPKPIYKEFISKEGMKIWVGKNAKVNEELTFRLANGRDWWLHVSGYPGSHVIIRLGKEERPDDDTLQDAMQLALHYSKARDSGEGEVCYTQRKHVARLGKGKTGQVQVAKHQSAWVRFDPVRYNTLKERFSSKIPD